MSNVYSRLEAAKYLKIGVTTLWRLTKDSQIASIQIGSRRLYREEDLNRFLSSRLGAKPASKYGVGSHR